jgi:hypothetical protein
MEFLDYKQPPKPEHEVTFKHYVFKYGIFIFIGHIAVDAIQNITKMPMAFFTLGISIYLMGHASREHRENDLGGKMSFKRAFWVSWLTGVFSLLFTNIYSFVALHFFMKDDLLADIAKIKDKQDEASLLIAQALELLLTPVGFVFAIFVNMIFYALICLIIAAIQKRK